MDPRVNKIFIIFPWIFFVQPFNYTVFIAGNDQSAVIGMAVWMDNEGGKTSMLSMKLFKAMKINIKNYITVDKKKIIGKSFPGFYTAPRRFPAVLFRCSSLSGNQIGRHHQNNL